MPLSSPPSKRGACKPKPACESKQEGIRSERASEAVGKSALIPSCVRSRLLSVLSVLPKPPAVTPRRPNVRKNAAWGHASSELRGCHLRSTRCVWHLLLLTHSDDGCHMAQRVQQGQLPRDVGRAPWNNATREGACFKLVEKSELKIPLEACAEHRFDHLAAARVMIIKGTSSCNELQMMLIARETTNPIRINAKTDSIIMRNFARCDKGMVSVGLKAVAAVKAR